jgi:5-hmdU DNA kinase-like protein
MINEQVNKFFAYARERYSIKLKRDDNQPKPWTTDAVLQGYRFCNVFREDDRTTIWFRQNVRNPMRHVYQVVFDTVMFRFINSIETGEDLLKAGLFQAYDSASFAFVLKQRKDAGKTMLGPAYMIKTPNGVNKITGLREIFGHMLPEYGLANLVHFQTTMQSLVEVLSSYHYVGPFMAYEIACDLQYTDFFKPTDTMTWANPGPGAKRGLQRLAWGTLGHASIPKEGMLECMRELLRCSQQVRYWPGHWPRWDMRTVEHTLCEFDKYERARLGEGTPKQKYAGT